MDLALKVGDRVRLTREAVTLYGGAWPHWVPQAQGGGTGGTVLFAGERPHKPGAAPRPYFVHWDNGAENSYRVEDLEPESPQEAMSEAEEPLPPNVIAFNRMPKDEG